MKLNRIILGKILLISILFTSVPLFVFSQENFDLPFDKIPTLEDISEEMGNPIRVITWMSVRGNMRFKRAVLCGNYERRFYVDNNNVTFEDRAEFKDVWQNWYKTGENKLAENETIETVLDIFLKYDLGLTIYQENIDKTMVIKFLSSNSNDDGYVYIYGIWYFIEGNL